MSLVYLDPANLPPMGESARQAVIHLKNAIDQRTILPMVYDEQRVNEDGSLNIVPAFVDPMTSKSVELLLDALRTVSGRVFQTASNHCRCAERYNALEDAKLHALAEFANYSPNSKKQEKAADILNARLAEIDKQIDTMFGGDVPPETALSVSEPPCKFCGKPRRVPEWAAFTEPSFLQNILKLSLGGEFPLNYLPLLLEAIDAWIYNPDIIPPAKKKRVDEVLTKMHYFKMKDLLIEKISSLFTSQDRELMTIIQRLQEENEHLTTLIQSYNGQQSATPPSTNTTGVSGASPRPTLTPDFRPESNGSTMTNTANTEEN